MIRLENLPDRQFVERVKQLERTVEELKSGVQYVEAKMYEYSSGSSYDLTGSLAASAGGGAILARIIVTATSTDAAAFLSSFVPQLWIPDLVTPYEDKLTNNYGTTFNKIVTSDVTNTEFWINIYARNAVGASTFYFKARIYASAPVTVVFARTV